MQMTELIRKKRDGGVLTEGELHDIAMAAAGHTVPDYQLSALLMAIYFRGLNEQETTALTLAMAASGDQNDLSEFGNLTVDKHSTGGVGDKTTIAIAPMAAALGCKVAKISGRGLGHTGGTVDKLESIPGFRTALSPQEFLSQIRSIGVAVVGQTGNMVPADKALYALRDVTETVDNHSLIAASIMSKKLAAGAHNIVLDVKFGSGAFMKTFEAARELAEEMVAIGQNAGRKVTALITNMNEPLGNAVGNAFEVAEAVSVLRGEAPQDLTTLCIALSSELYASCFHLELSSAEAAVKKAVADGSAMEKLLEMVSAQGGDTEYILHPERMPVCAENKQILSPSDGYISAMDTAAVGRACLHTGAGREKMDDVIDHSAGIRIFKKPGDRVKKGEPLAQVYSARPAEQAADELLHAYQFSQTPPEKQPLIGGRAG